MRKRVFLCRLFFGLSCLLGLGACGSDVLSRLKIPNQRLYYDYGTLSPFEELRSEWIATGEKEPWRFYYALSYIRSLDKKDEAAHIYLYFLIQQEKGKDSPPAFTLSQANGQTLSFVRINTYDELKLPFIGLEELKDASAERRFSSPPILKLKSAPLIGNVYVLDPLVDQKPLDWSALRALYEQASNQQAMTFTWTGDKTLEASLTSFPLILKSCGIQGFMCLVKNWGL